MTPINKDNIEYLAGLARIELKDAEKEKLLGDLTNILNHFEELKEVDTKNVEPMTGGTLLTNIERKDEIDTERLGKGKSGFPETKKGYLKVPPVFED